MIYIKIHIYRILRLTIIFILVFNSFNFYAQVTDKYDWVLIEAPDQILTYTNKSTKIELVVSCMDGKNFQYKWDYGNDGIIDYVSNIPESYYKYNIQGDYKLKIRVVNEHNIENFKIIDVSVLNGNGEIKYNKRKIQNASLSAKGTSLIINASVMSAVPGDGIQKNYAILIGGTDDMRWSSIVSFYNILKNKYSTPEEDIYVLNPTDVTPSNNSNIIDGLATLENVETIISNITGKMDDDDLLIFFIEWHGNGYLGYVPTNPRNAAYHGYFGSPPLIAGPNDEQDYIENNLEFSILCGRGGLNGKDFHYGLNQWGLVDGFSGYVTPYQLYRYKALSHFTNIYVEGLGYLSDNDVYIEILTDYLLGDLDKDGYWDAGENWDYDNDGIQPYDLATNTFDEDDWGNLDNFQDNNTIWHSSIFKPFVIYDANLDNILDIDVNATMQTPVNQLEVDGSDIDNDGCIEGFDLNDDGDKNDWVAINENMSIYGTILSDDDVKQLLDQITVGKKLFITNTCYGGGFVDDLSGNNTIVMAGCSELENSSATYFSGQIANSFGSYLSDNNDDIFISVPEAFNFAWETRPCCLSDRFQYDDNGDKISHEYPIPNGGEGVLGNDVSLDAISIIVKPNESITISDDYLLNNSSKLIMNPNSTLIINNCKLQIESNSTIYLRAGSNLQILGNGKISVKNDGYVCVENTSNIFLQNFNNAINLYSGYQVGLNSNIFENIYSNCELITSIAYTGDGSINILNQNAYLQNITVTSNLYIPAENNISVGENVTIPPYGAVYISSGSNVILDADGDILLDKGTNIQGGSTFEVK